MRSFFGLARLAPLALVAFALSLSGELRADEVVRSRWQVLPLTSLFYSSQSDQVVSASFDLPCGASPLGVLLIDQGSKLQLAALVTRPLAACARLPERRSFRLPFIDSTAYKLIEPLRGDLDGLRVEELNAVAVTGLGKAPQLRVEVPCGVKPAGIAVIPGRLNATPVPMQLVAIGFRDSARRVTAECGSSDGEIAAAPRQAVIRVGGLVAAQERGRHFAWQVMPRKVNDLRKLGVLGLRGIDRMESLKGKTGRLGVLHFKRRCFEVPVGIALLPNGNSQVMAVAVARYLNAPCLTRQAKIPALAFEEETISLVNPRARALRPEELSRFGLGQLLLVPGTKGDVGGVVLTSPGEGFPRGYFAFVARSASPAGVTALRQAGIQLIDTSNPLAVASRMAAAAGFPRTAVAGTPLRLQITSAM